jgi:F-type H+-transporting ATPase subunit alpha
VSIFAGTQGHLDDLPVNRVLAFEKALLKHVHDEFPEILEELAAKGELTEALAGTLKEVIRNFKAQFGAKK